MILRIKLKEKGILVISFLLKNLVSQKYVVYELILKVCHFGFLMTMITESPRRKSLLMYLSLF